MCLLTLRDGLHLYVLIRSNKTQRKINELLASNSTHVRAHYQKQIDKA